MLNPITVRKVKIFKYKAPPSKCLNLKIAILLYFKLATGQIFRKSNLIKTKS